ncbi:Z1A alpha zein protein [Zea mays]|uniref:Z1A alpha zein protein n=1 Tax=Zea mays TaxID=4577 RepID=A0A1D6PVL9_MAIZE|nr:Z1A alpha zein protein [Zea mays]
MLTSSYSFPSSPIPLTSGVFSM